MYGMGAKPPMGAISSALKTGQMQAPQTGAAAQDMRELAKDPRFIALAQQVGPEMAMQILKGEQQQGRAATSAGVAALGQAGQQEDARSQFGAMAGSARA
jgi:hypothetical protein